MMTLSLMASAFQCSSFGPLDGMMYCARLLGTSRTICTEPTGMLYPNGPNVVSRSNFTSVSISRQPTSSPPCGCRSPSALVNVLVIVFCTREKFLTIFSSHRTPKKIPVARMSSTKIVPTPERRFGVDDELEFEYSSAMRSAKILYASKKLIITQ